MCHLTAALVQRALDARGIATVSLSVLREISEKLRPSRWEFVDNPLGFTLGKTHDRVAHEAVAMRALKRLER